MIHTDLFDHHFIPARRLSEDGEKRLMIVLHGRGDSLRPFRDFDDELDLPEMNFLLLNGNRRLSRNGFSWCGLKSPEAGLKRTRARLSALLEDLVRDGWNPRRIFIFGFSEGCLAASDFAMACARPLGGVIGVSGCLHLSPRWRSRLAKGARRTPWLFTHGLRDSVIRIDEMREGARKLRGAGLPVDWVELNKKHEIEPSLELPLIRSWIESRARLKRTSPAQPKVQPAR